MAGIGSKDTKPALAVRRYLHRLGFRFDLHVSKLPGKPDIVLGKHRAIIFVQGCYWHRHSNCRYTTTPSSNVGKWTEKFSANIARDSRNTAALCDKGWRVFLILEMWVEAQACRESFGVIAGCSCELQALFCRLASHKEKN
jgi:DNA mismatch endonuclease (patch repair protein)